MRFVDGMSRSLWDRMAMVGAAMELFMIHTGFYDKVTVIESEKRAWESSPEAQAIKDALNPWRKQDEEPQKKT